MTSLSQQVSQLSKELQEMTRLLRPLLVIGSQPLLTALNPTMPMSPSSNSGPTIPTPPVPSPTASPSSPLRPTSSLLDSVDAGGIGLPSCLIPTSPPQRPQTRVQVSPKGCPRGPSLPSLLCPVTGQTEGSGPPSQAHTHDQPTQAPLTFSFSLPSFRSQSPSCSPCQGPHLSRPAGHSRGLLPPPVSQDNPPQSSHCSAPPSVSNSPGDHRLGVSPFPSSSAPSIQSRSCTPPSCPHASPPCNLDSLPESQVCSSWHQRNPKPASPQLEIEMQEWAPGGTPSTEHISFIDEEGPPL